MASRLASALRHIWYRCLANLSLQACARAGEWRPAARPPRRPRRQPRLPARRPRRPPLPRLQRWTLALLRLVMLCRAGGATRSAQRAARCFTSRPLSATALQAAWCATATRTRCANARRRAGGWCIATAWATSKRWVRARVGGWVGAACGLHAATGAGRGRVSPVRSSRGLQGALHRKMAHRAGAGAGCPGAISAMPLSRLNLVLRTLMYRNPRAAGADGVLGSAAAGADPQPCGRRCRCSCRYHGRTWGRCGCWRSACRNRAIRSGWIRRRRRVCRGAGNS